VSTIDAAMDRLDEAMEALTKITERDVLPDDMQVINLAFGQVLTAKRLLSSCGGPPMLIGDLPQQSAAGGAPAVHCPIHGKPLLSPQGCVECSQPLSWARRLE
jgi:hypothetical protein